MLSNVISLLLIHDGLLIDPFGLLPTLKLDEDLVGIHGLVQVEVDLAHDGFTCEVELLVNLDEDLSHLNDNKSCIIKIPTLSLML